MVSPPQPRDEVHDSRVSLDRVAAVVIGRNEGGRLEICLGSLLRDLSPERVVYVDSGSRDGSPDVAESLGVRVHRLDPDRPFSAARGRNEGFDVLMEFEPGIELVQFVDGDCEMLEGWLQRGVSHFEGRADLAALCGRTLERYREQTIYNRLCDIEFDVPPGEVRATGGIFMIRAAAFRQVGGMRVDVIAGEEPEMGLRLRRAGWRLERVATPMVLHDSAMTRFSQWWKRAVRGGVGTALGAALHGREAERYCIKELRRALTWGLVLPLAAVSAAWPTRGLSLAVYAGLVGVQGLRITWRARKSGRSLPDAVAYAVACILAKFAGVVGIVKYQLDRRRGRSTGIVEYK